MVFLVVSVYPMEIPFQVLCLSDFDRFSLGIKVTAKDADMLYVVSNFGPRFFWNDDCLVRSLCRQSIP